MKWMPPVLHGVLLFVDGSSARRRLPVNVRPNTAANLKTGHAEGENLTIDLSNTTMMKESQYLQLAGCQIDVGHDRSSLTAGTRPRRHLCAPWRVAAFRGTDSANGKVITAAVREERRRHIAFPAFMHGVVGYHAVEAAGDKRQFVPCGGSGMGAA
jgi:hypothetical protein